MGYTLKTTCATPSEAMKTILVMQKAKTVGRQHRDQKKSRNQYSPFPQRLNSQHRVRTSTLRGLSPDMLTFPPSSLTASNDFPALLLVRTPHSRALRSC